MKCQAWLGLCLKLGQLQVSEMFEVRGLALWFSAGADFAPWGHLQCLETFRVAPAKGVLLGSGGGGASNATHLL